MTQSKEAIISKLRQDIIAWEGFKPPQPGLHTSFGLGPLEASFPNKVFPTGAIHEMLSTCPEETAACGAFITALVSNLLVNGGACIWISWSRRIYPPALKLFGVDPDKVIFVDVPLQKDVLWVMEEALKCEGAAAVICETSQLNFLESQRLQLAVEKTQVTGFVLRKNAKKITTTACVTRWYIRPVRSHLRPGIPGVGHPRWQVELQKVKNGAPGTWTLEWQSQGFRNITQSQVTEQSRRYA